LGSFSVSEMQQRKLIFLTEGSNSLRGEQSEAGNPDARTAK